MYIYIPAVPIGRCAVQYTGFRLLVCMPACHRAGGVRLLFQMIIRMYIITSICCTPYVSLIIVQPGWGWSDGLAKLCEKGTWNPGGTRTPCEECSVGLTTAAPGATSPSQCIPAAGSHGPDSTTCPAGMYVCVDD
jgi:hypothetical protein